MGPLGVQRAEKAAKIPFPSAVMRNFGDSDANQDIAHESGSGAVNDPLTAAEQVEELRRRLDASEQSGEDARACVRLLHGIINALPVGLTLQGPDGRLLLANEAAVAQVSTVPSTGDADVREPALAATIAQRHERAPLVLSDAPLMIEENIGTADGARTLLTLHRQLPAAEGPLLLSASLDYTERKEVERQLLDRASFDELTGLPNRSTIQEHIEQLLAQGPGARFAIAFLDIDNFKHINDYYTHSIGDALLVKVAQRVTAEIRESDVLCRISGDEFLIVMSPIRQDDDLADLIDRLVQRLKEPFLIEGFEIFTSASIGVSIYPDHGESYEVLRRSADAAMYRAKAEIKGGAALFDSSLARTLTSRIAEEQRLRVAVRDQLFCCAYQPKVDLHTEEVVGLEALIRWRDENGVIRAPGTFVALAVELGLIDDLTYLVLAEIMKSRDLLDEAFGPGITISINVAAKQACNTEFMRGFCEELHATQCAERFMIEVTEDAFVAKSRFQREVLPILREIGTRVSIDDFGTGYSSLSALADITADEIKIDRSFITDIHLRPRNQSVLKSIEALSEALGMSVVAEGIETAEELEYLRTSTRIRYGQGYYFAKPLLLEELVPSRRTGQGRLAATPRERVVQREARGKSIRGR
jgi:diguanylate cyclase (GGDEF)-like protein